MAVSNEYRENMKETFTRIVYHMSKDKLFVAVGLELVSIDVVFDDNDTFSLKDMTFGFYNPLTNTIHINIEDPFFTCCSSEDERAGKLFFIIFHEASHKLLMHSERLNGRDPSLWNIAADYEVHNMLHLNKELIKAEKIVSLSRYVEIASNIVESPKATNTKKGEYSFMYSEKVLDKIAEEIYQMIQNSKVVSQETSYFKLDSDGSISNNDCASSNENNQNGNKNENENDGDCNSNSNSNDNGNDDNNGKKSSSGKSCKEVGVTVTTYTLPDGKKYPVISMDWPDPDKFVNKTEEQKNNDKNNQELRKQLWENNISSSAEKSKGSLSSASKSFLKKLFRVKIDWEKILKNSLNTILQKADEFSWARTRITTFALDLPTLPGIDDSESGKGTLIVARDESGSMSDEDVAKAASIIIDAKEHYKKIIVLKHDIKIAEIKEFEDANDEVKNMLLERAACGGTSHQYVFSFLIDYYRKHKYDEDKISCFISITDGCSDIQSYQDDIPGDIPLVYLAPANCLEYFKGVKGQVIPIEI